MNYVSLEKKGPASEKITERSSKVSFQSHMQTNFVCVAFLKSIFSILDSNMFCARCNYSTSCVPQLPASTTMLPSLVYFSRVSLFCPFKLSSFNALILSVLFLLLTKRRFLIFCFLSSDGFGHIEIGQVLGTTFL